MNTPRINAPAREARGLHHNPGALALIEALFPAGRILPGPDAQAVAASVAGYGQHIPGLVPAIDALLLWLDTRFLLAHGRRFRSAPLAQRREFLRKHAQGDLTAHVLRLLSTPFRAAYLLDDANLRKVGSHNGIRVPAQVERQRWQQQVTPIEDLPGSSDFEADVVVIGTGAGGAAAALTLASRGLAVLMIEEGRYHDRRDFNGRLTDVIPKLYRAAGTTVALGNTVIPVPVGKTVGGTTTVNSGTCLRTPDAVLTEWVDAGLTDFSPEQMEPYFNQVEEVLQVQRADPRYVGEIGARIAEGAAALGLKQAHPLTRNAVGCDGQGLCQFGCPTDAKQSTNVSYVPRALAAGAFLLTGLKAKRLLWDQRQIIGLEADGVDANGLRKQVRVRTNQVVVAMGTFFTPLFLQDNGIRNAWLGRNLSLHPCGAVTGHYADMRFDHAQRIPQGFGVADLAQEGLLFEGGTPPFVAHGLLNPFVGDDFVDFAEQWQHTGYFGFMIRDRSRGRVRRGPHPDVPLIRYDMNPDDFALFKRGLATLARMHLRAGADYVHLLGHSAAPKIHNERELDAALDRIRKPRQVAISAYHPLGTARIAADANQGVCDPDHRVFGTSGLYVMDGSSVPSSLGANPQVTIMAMATRAAEKLAQHISAHDYTPA
ncbi:MAG TPA: GMC family oxidoreductase [Dongiaceae bacterium]|nr:GMC family oxidoreductase [Dongiaceae bacterium]